VVACQNAIVPFQRVFSPLVAAALPLKDFVDGATKVLFESIRVGLGKFIAFKKGINRIDTAIVLAQGRERQMHSLRLGRVVAEPTPIIFVI